MSRSQPVPQPSAILPLILSAIPFLALVVVIFKYEADLPVWDDWYAALPIVEKLYNGTLALTDFWSQHNEHRPIVPRLLILPIIRLSRWNMSYLLMLNLAIGAGIFLLLYRQIAKTMKEVSATGFGWWVPILALLLFSVAQDEIWFRTDGCLPSLNVLALVTGALVLQMRSLGWCHFLAAVTCGVVATYSFANGAVFWLIGWPLFWLSSSHPVAHRKKFLAVWLLAAILCLASYLYNYQVSEIVSQSARFALDHPLSYLKYVLTYLGGPACLFFFPVFFPDYVWFVGLAGILFCLLMSWLLTTLPNIRWQILLPYWVLAGYALLSAFLTGVGRLNFGTTGALMGHYKTIGNLLWVSNIVYLSLLLQARPLGSTGHVVSLIKASASLTLFGMAALIITSSVSILPWLELRKQNLLMDRRQLYLLNDEEHLKRILPNTDQLKGGVAFLKKHRLSLFR